MKNLFLFSLLILGTFTYGQNANPSQTSDIKKVALDNETTLIDRVSQDKDYGYTEKKAIKVGGDYNNSGPENEHNFINALCGPNGEKLSYRRIGSCCPFKLKNSLFKGFLDVYEIRYNGQKEPTILYLNMYESGGDIEIPYGFTLKK